MWSSKYVFESLQNKLCGSFTNLAFFLLQQFDLLLYYQFRHWLIRNGLESLLTALEDIVIYRYITAPSSRVKWAHAIMTSIQRESNTINIFHVLTTGSGSSPAVAWKKFTTPSSTVSSTIPGVTRYMLRSPSGALPNT
jgi:hypothetical protein